MSDLGQHKPGSSTQWGQASMAGIMLVACIFVGTGIGVWLDNWSGKRPLFMLVFMLLGIIAGFYNVYRILVSLQQQKK